MTLQLQAVHIATGSDDIESRLVFSDGFLVAILVQLSGQHGADAGMWFLEVAFGQASAMSAPLFLDLDAAQAWIAQELDAKTGSSRSRPATESGSAR